MYVDDHPPPHFHLRSPNSNGQIRLDTLQVMGGHYDPKEFVEAVTWVSEYPNMKFLVDKWMELNERD
jgi:hypothetical protein